MGGHSPTISDYYLRLAEQFGKEGMERFKAKRNKAVVEIYLEYGLSEAARITGWSHQACLNFIHEHGKACK
jgi:hypothetical protein